jgi:hypothetical protein
MLEYDPSGTDAAITEEKRCTTVAQRQAAVKKEGAYILKERLINGFGCAEMSG